MNQMSYGIVTLLLCVIVIHSIYSLVIRPRADQILAQRAAIVASNASGETNDAATPSLRSIWVILRDHEQEAAITLGLWAFTLIGYHARQVIRDRRMLQRNLLEVREDFVILPEDVRALSRHVGARVGPDGQRLLPRTLNVALARFAVTRSVHEAAAAAREECEAEAASLDADLSMLRFVVWAIPAVGFVGTVRGIGNALQDAQRALGGDISGVTLGLGITFNATLTALTLCIIVMFMLHQLQQAQDRMVLDTKAFVDQNVISRLRVQ